MMIILYLTAGADDLFSGSVRKAESSDEEPEVAPKKPSGGGLFADDEDDLFSVTPAKKEPPKRKGLYFTRILKWTKHRPCRSISLQEKFVLLTEEQRLHCWISVWLYGCIFCQLMSCELPDKGPPTLKCA